MSLKKRVDKLETNSGMMQNGALVNQLPDGRYHWVGHEDQTYTLEAIEARLKPGSMILNFDLPTEAANEQQNDKAA
jgi:hypothetical protein